ncbi:hypothetical protein MHM84_09695 [Halomonas sp. McH1-25]|uniref:hypothetical protein n=1 Tax=unclassified Halomonas TaxID=2609666 RepID=UPI001EF5E425|nr:MULTISPECIES: hypothetical protein [unclassified Halomonas]MCG7600062.1 hypothetical protein [Halomonas sp. McH1-25]MCP1344260.1 hypothetical protein [Halomonas sp. FL8]MCP1363021.1 hypothetical protein [Halomonas sp. BBD45]
MNMTEMGEVVAYLLRYRTAERQPGNGRKRRAAREGQLAERDVCALIDDALDTEREALRDFLAGQGLRLKVFESGDYPGIAPGSRLYALLPDPELEQPPLYTREPVFDALRLRQESRAELAQWYLQLWLLMQTLLYTRLNRALSDVSRYQEATFATSELVGLLREQLETLRAQGEGVPETSRVLLEERGEDVARRVKAFIDLQVRAGQLETVRDARDGAESDIWQQTLLGALEAEQVGAHHLSHLVDLLSGEPRPAAREDDDEATPADEESREADFAPEADETQNELPGMDEEAETRSVNERAAEERA